MFFESYDNKNEGINIFCFPYAGGGSLVFREWKNRFGEEFSIYGAHYPGHEDRIMEKPLWDIEELVDKIHYEMKNRDFDKKPFILFGHSLGSRVAYELSLRFEEENNKWLKGLIVSAGRSPDKKEKNPIYDLPEREFFEKLSRYNKTPREIFENKDLWELFEPVLRADFTMAETYEDKKYRKIHVPILALKGTLDYEMTREDIEGWASYTTNDFYYKEITGEHLFIDTNAKEVIMEIKKYIKKECFEGIYA
ncbi:thioesterase II family protein [Acetitomaculum ruminis]|uniref:thioesterase II family protein n=1 Tax=Acetitomaculum ruminis TaxID=2382 RepID=UPI0015A54DE2|nr:thioesterase [Acetitomaculum ruminis]